MILSFLTNSLLTYVLILIIWILILSIMNFILINYTLNIFTTLKNLLDEWENTFVLKLTILDLSNGLEILKPLDISDNDDLALILICGNYTINLLIIFLLKFGLFWKKISLANRLTLFAYNMIRFHNV